MPEIELIEVDVPVEVPFLRVDEIDGENVWLWLVEDGRGRAYDVCVVDAHPDYWDSEPPPARYRVNETVFLRLLDRVLDAPPDTDVRLGERGVSFPWFHKETDSPDVVTAHAPCGEARVFTVDELEATFAAVKNLEPWPSGVG